MRPYGEYNNNNNIIYTRGDRTAIKKTARTRDNFSMYEQKNHNDNNGFPRHRVHCRYTCFYYNTL